LNDAIATVFQDVEGCELSLPINLMLQMGCGKEKVIENN
jgi:hypothetical protein